MMEPRIQGDGCMDHKYLDHIQWEPDKHDPSIVLLIEILNDVLNDLVLEDVFLLLYQYLVQKAATFDSVHNPIYFETANINYVVMACIIGCFCLFFHLIYKKLAVNVARVMGCECNNFV